MCTFIYLLYSLSLSITFRKSLSFFLSHIYLAFLSESHCLKSLFPSHSKTAQLEEMFSLVYLLFISLSLSIQFLPRTYIRPNSSLSKTSLSLSLFQAKNGLYSSLQLLPIVLHLQCDRLARLFNWPLTAFNICKIRNKR